MENDEIRNLLIIYEYDSLICEGSVGVNGNGIHEISKSAYKWLEEKCLHDSDDEKVVWLRRNPRRGQPTLQVLNHVGVICTPCGLQLEVLPKIGKTYENKEIAIKDARRNLLKMLKCLYDFKNSKHIEHAHLLAEKMPLLEVFIQQFLKIVQDIVRRGLRGNYASYSDNLNFLRGKLQFSEHLRRNLFRPDRFFTEHDEYTLDRPENRLIHSALLRVAKISRSAENIHRARELEFYFLDIPVSKDYNLDFKKVRHERGMECYADALIWVRLILDDESPITTHGNIYAPSFLWPMEKLFETYIGKKIPEQLNEKYFLKTSVHERYMVTHGDDNWFKMKPDFLIGYENFVYCILDAKWKMLDQKLNNKKVKYKLSQSDFYQLCVYGLSYGLTNEGFLVLIYPKSDTFSKPLNIFQFNVEPKRNLWVLPFDIDQDKLVLPELQQDSEENLAAKVLLNVFKE